MKRIEIGDNLKSVLETLCICATVAIMFVTCS